jgi:hypothetical protein
MIGPFWIAINCNLDTGRDLAQKRPGVQKVRFSVQACKIRAGDLRTCNNNL